MKFLCGSCRTKYQISDDKVRGKILTIRCKKCGAKILVREALAKEAEGGAVMAPVAEARAASGGSVGPRAGGSASMAAAYEASLGRAPVDEPDDMPTSIAPVPTDAGLAGYEWYVAIEGQQHGPFAFAELVQKVKAGQVIARHYAWHDGMEDWSRVRDVRDLQPYLPEAPAPKAVPPPPPDDARGAGAEVLDFTGRTAPERAGGREDVFEPEEPAAPMAHGTVPEGHPSEVSLQLEEEDIFAQVPRASQQELVQRESTRFFVHAAGVPNERKRTRLGLALGLVLLLGVGGFVGLWASGVVPVSLPLIGNPFASGPVVTTAQTYDGSSDDDSYELLLGEVAVEPVTTGREKKAKRRSRRTRSAGRVREEALPELGDTALPELEAGDYVEESGRGARARSTRGEAEAAPAVSIGGVGSKIALDTQTRLTKLPNETDLSVPPPDTDVLDAAMIQRVVRSKQASVRLCYEKSLKARENISGKLAVALVVEPSGRVTNADIVSPAFRGSVVGDCIVRSIKGWRFPRFQGGAQEIELPFVFQKGV